MGKLIDNNLRIKIQREILKVVAKHNLDSQESLFIFQDIITQLEAVEARRFAQVADTIEVAKALKKLRDVDK